MKISETTRAARAALQAFMKQFGRKAGTISGVALEFAIQQTPHSTSPQYNPDDRALVAAVNAVFHPRSIGGYFSLDECKFLTTQKYQPRKDLTAPVMGWQVWVGSRGTKIYLRADGGIVLDFDSGPLVA